MWIVGWALGISKSFDIFMITMAIVVLAATARILAPYLPGSRGD